MKKRKRPKTSSNLQGREFKNQIQFFFKSTFYGIGGEVVCEANMKYPIFTHDLTT